MAEMIKINFSRSFPIFPLADMCLLPHARVPLHIFEPRYVRMIDAALDGSSQIAMASFKGEEWKHTYHGNPPLRSAVCIGQIERYEKIPDDRYNIMLQGICRAKIVEEYEPSTKRLYRTARLAPLEVETEDSEEGLAPWRSRMREILSSEPLSRMRMSDSVIEWIDSEQVPSHVLVELVGHLIMTTSEDADRRYRLLSEPDPIERARYTETQLALLSSFINEADAQREDWPKGCPLN